ncbi:hypothetical protein TNCV_1004911 [Trichonephila clavipes]|nr:hypothetical protein TNCV_1004911 [Trichonephila clavipes]
MMRLSNTTATIWPLPMLISRSCTAAREFSPATRRRSDMNKNQRGETYFRVCERTTLSVANGSKVRDPHQTCPVDDVNQSILCGSERSLTVRGLHALAGSFQGRFNIEIDIKGSTTYLTEDLYFDAKTASV